MTAHQVSLHLGNTIASAALDHTVLPLSCIYYPCAIVMTEVVLPLEWFTCMIRANE